MGILKDLIDVATTMSSDVDFDMDDIFNDDDNLFGSSIRRVKRCTSNDSIAKQAKHGVMQFPVLASKSLAFSDVQIAAKACERNFAHLLQVIFSMNQISDTSDPIEYIRQFHQNVDTTGSGTSALRFVFNSDLSAVERNDIMRRVQEGLVTFEEMFTLTSLNSKYIPRDTRVTVSMETGGRRIGSFTNPRGSGGGRGRRGRDDDDDNDVVYNPDWNLPKQLFVDGDVKKCNELVPTLLHVRILRPNDNGKDIFIDFIVGVKAVVHPLTSEEIIKHVVEVYKDRGTLFKIITWTTGEISFFKDLVLNVDQIKDEIKEVRSGKASTWWSALKNIKAKRRLNKYTRRSPVLPNATLVLSMEEVEFIKANFQFDVLEDKYGKKLLEGLNILQVCVMDSSSEIMYSFIDGSQHWEVITYKALERDAGNSDKQFKEILKAVNKLQ